MPIHVLLNGSDYSVNLYNLAFDTKKYPNHHDIVQIRYSRNSPIAVALRLAFAATNKKIEEHSLAGKPSNRLSIPAKEQEYIMQYSSGNREEILLDLITIKDVERETVQYAALPKKR